MFFFFKQKTAYEMRISDWSSDVCSSDLLEGTGVTANILGPGTFVKPAPIVLDDGTVIRPDHGPEIMAAPIRWLASRQSSEVSGMRVSAASWVAELPGDEQPSGAICPIDWTKST